MREHKFKAWEMKNKFPKTVKGYLSRVKSLDDSPELLKDYDKLNEYQKDVLKDMRSQVAECIDSLTYEEKEYPKGAKRK